MLASAPARPATRLYGEEMHPSLIPMAAAILRSIVTGHPLGDGNPRLGWLALVISLDRILERVEECLASS